MTEMSDSAAISTRQQKIAAQARLTPDMGFTSLNHHIDIDWLREAYKRTRKDGASGIDKVTAEDYAMNLEANLRDLLERAKSGRYRAPAVRRVHIPKGDGSETRPIGIPTFEDKVLQRAVAMALEPIYEQDFLDCSYGFRPGRNQHQALQALWKRLMDDCGGWVIEVDIQKYFDTLDKAQLRVILSRRVRDGVLLRLIGKWLNAGVWEAGGVTHPEAGTPQGGVISPLLSNIYLHEVLDTWFEGEVKPRLHGRGFLIRFADDALLVFTNEGDARRVMEVLPKRFEKYGLTLHPKKTRLLEFRPPKPPKDPMGPADGPGSGSFDLLGFTHFWAKSRKGNWVVKQKTAKDRFSRAVRTIAHWCRHHRHRPVSEQWQMLCRKVDGHNGYYGITGNSRALVRFRQAVWVTWVAWLRRRSQRAHKAWAWFDQLKKRFPLPPPIARHSTLRRAANPVS